jgi:hypothetical protein
MTLDLRFSRAGGHFAIAYDTRTRELFSWVSARRITRLVDQAIAEAKERLSR